MTPEEFQQKVWGDPIVPNLPKFERAILAKRGINIKVKPKSELDRIKREQTKLERGYGKQPNMVNNPIYGKTLDWRCFSRIRGVVTSLQTAPTHKGFKVLESVIINLLTKYPTLHVKLLEWDYGYSNTHANDYMSTIKYVLNSLSNIELENTADINKTVLSKLL